MRRSNEPIAWSLFGAGGMMLAFCGPAVICATLALGFISAEQPEVVQRSVATWLAHPIGKLFLFGFIALSLYHTVHRLYHGLHDLHVMLPRIPMLLICYGGATVLSALCGLLLMQI